MTEIPGPPAGFNELLDHYTLEHAKQREGYNGFPLRPSSAGKCTRELGYALMEHYGHATYEKEPLKPEIHRVFSLGHSMEYHMVGQFRKAFSVAPEPIQIRYAQQVLSFFETASGRLVEGSIDGVFISEEWGAVIDYKSKKDRFDSAGKSHWDVSSTTYSRMDSVTQFGVDAFYVDDLVTFVNELEVTDPFFARNFWQLNFYFFSEDNFLRDRGVTFASIIQYNKNDSRLREIRFKPSQALYNKVKTKFQLADEEVYTKKTADHLPRDYALGSSACAFCNYRDECHGSKDALKEYFKTLGYVNWPKDTDRMDPEIGGELERLYGKYREGKRSAIDLEAVQQDMIKIFQGLGIYKVRFSDGQILQMKALKSGGKGDGRRIVIREGKLK